MELNVKKLLEITNGKLLSGKVDTIINNFERDTRVIKENDFFIAIKGNSSDGNDFWEDALNKGAIGCIIDKLNTNNNLLRYKDKVIIKVENTIKAIQQIAAWKRKVSDAKLIAVTGSVGKTSTKDIIAEVLSAKYKVLKTEGNYNNELGLPLTLLRLKDEEIIVLEMGMNHLGEISLLTNIAKPDCAVITNIGTAHIGNLGSRENILKAKLEILEGLSLQGKVIINNDNDLLNNWHNNNKEISIGYGIYNKSEFMAYNLLLEEEKSKYNIKINNEKYTVEIPIVGEHFIYNSLCAITVGNMFKVDIEQIIKTMKNIKITKNRMSIEKIKEYTVINDTYNASFDSVKEALKILKQKTGNKKIAVLGDMLELGEFSKQIHENLGEEVIKNNIDILITVGENSKNIANKSIELGIKKENVYICDELKTAIEIIKTIVKKGDIILLKASNSMKFNTIFEALKEE